MKKATIILLGLFTALSAFAEKLTYEIDSSHSSVNFTVRHYLNDLTGSFKNFEGTITVDTDDMTKSSTTATISAESINTDHDERDSHLRDRKYFNVAKFPSLTFESTKWEKISDKKYKVSGNLTMLGESKPVAMDVEYLGKMDGVGHNAGKEIIGFKGETVLDKSDWDLSVGGPIVGDEVKVAISIQGHRTK